MTLPMTLRTGDAFYVEDLATVYTEHTVLPDPFKDKTIFAEGHSDRKPVFMLRRFMRKVLNIATANCVVSECDATSYKHACQLTSVSLCNH